MDKLHLEINKNMIKEPQPLEDKGILMTPPIDENYWLFRVKLHKNQAIVGFPKFCTIGIGFAQEEDWNTNLPYDCNTEEIYNHIRHNKKYKSIKKEDCLKAIKMIQEFVSIHKSICLN
jgi:hypothetical protein